ncbi:hypothetical protein CU098_014018 [Rhizopus stolonifer]|uniref:TLC domain-containing protein n=1 Tax=Rhizopus stolonifer TaxID=4846 RepID=A0A367KYM6_RHIST|nr:hypothetical protein CU098_014018 [Rhizopus stolonifer]
MVQKLSLIQVFSLPIVPISFLLSFTSLVLFFYYIKNRFVKTDKQVSWILTFASSLVCTVVSIPYFLSFWKSGWDMNLLSMDSNFHTAMVCFFISYLVLDLFLGSIYYRQRITVLTGWIHHPLTSCLLELPTLLLALGSFSDQWRCDLLFASTFFVLRIVFHTNMIVALKEHHRLQMLWMVALAIFPLHAYWFYADTLAITR